MPEREASTAASANAAATAAVISRYLIKPQASYHRNLLFIFKCNE